MELSGRVAFVTGASDGIGARIAAALASVGVDLLVGYHGRRDGALKTCGVVADLGRRAEVVHLDHPPSVETAIETAISRFGRLDGHAPAGLAPEHRRGERPDLARARIMRCSRS